LNCPIGYFCNLSGATTASLLLAAPTNFGLCSGGYVCFEGSTTATPNDGIMGL
jgi:hypothetical protein